MRRFYTRKPHGDTLIEVIFAFAILATIIGFAYTGAIQARKTAVSAQQRTQALLMAQYQSQALIAYRDSLPWDDGVDGVNTPSFKDGGSGNDPINSTDKFCLVFQDNSGVNQWQLLKQPSSQCDLTPDLPAPSGGKVIQITFRGSDDCGGAINDCESIIADIKIVWIDPYGQEASVTNIVQLTES